MSTAVANRAEIDKALRGKPIIRSADKPEGWRGGLSPEEISDITDALLAAGVFREPPTPAQIATALVTCGAQRQIDEWPERYRMRQAKAVLALFGGGDA